MARLVPFLVYVFIVAIYTIITEGTFDGSFKFYMCYLKLQSLALWGTLTLRTEQAEVASIRGSSNAHVT